MRKRGLGAGRAVLAYAGLSVLSRRWHRNWGATPREAAESLPGDQLVPRADLQTTRAITIDASPERVWPWLVQMGQGRGGLYTYEWNENLLGAKIHNLSHLDPDLQRLEAGDRIRLTPDLYLGRIHGQFYRVTEIRPDHAVVMLQELPTGGLSSWSFTLRLTDATVARTRGEIVINRPTEEVFDFVADERNEPQYNPRMLHTEKTSAGPVGLGADFKHT